MQHFHDLSGTTQVCQSVAPFGEEVDAVEGAFLRAKRVFSAASVGRFLLQRRDRIKVILVIMSVAKQLRASLILTPSRLASSVRPTSASIVHSLSASSLSKPCSFLDVRGTEEALSNRSAHLLHVMIACRVEGLISNAQLPTPVEVLVTAERSLCFESWYIDKDGGRVKGRVEHRIRDVQIVCCYADDGS